MSLSLQECINKLKEAHPDLYPVSYIEDKGVYLFNLLKRGVNKNEATANFYVINPEDGKVYGPVPVMSIMENEVLQDKLARPHMISGEDQKALVHSEPQNGAYWAATRNTDGVFLSHYGVKGQQWGVRRFQDENGKLTPAGKERYGEGKNKGDESTSQPQQKLTLKEKIRLNTAKQAEKILDGMEEEANIDREKTKQGDASKKVLKDIAFTVLDPVNVVFLASDGVMAAVAKTKVNKYMKNREEKSTPDEATGLRIKKDGAYNEKEDLAAVNPGFMDMNSNTKNNCMLCTTTYDLRKRGYDVTAQLDSQGYGFMDLRRWYPKAEIQRTSRYNDEGKGISQKEYVDKTIKNLIKQGDGARGNIMMFWNLGGGHSIVYEVQNGKVLFKDGQSNKVYTDKKVSQLLNQTITNAYVRIDNVDPDIERIKKECVR